LRQAGHRVFVVAPASDHSGLSHSVSFFTGPCKLTLTEEDTWACEGTPADCVVIALLGGIPELSIIAETEASPPDAILSGINRGANLGTDIIYSGTAAAARQGSFCGIPSAALSLVEGDAWHWETAVSFVIKHLAQILAGWKPDSFINVNIPNTKEMPVSLIHAFPSIRYYNDRICTYKAPDGHLYCFADTGAIGAKAEKGSDYDVVAGNNAALSEIFIHPVLPESVLGRGEKEWHTSGRTVKNRY
jgi:5'-nucleotidase